jgi:hypothetical protein
MAMGFNYSSSNADNLRNASQEFNACVQKVGTDYP